MRRFTSVICAGSCLLALVLGCEVTIKPWNLLFPQQYYTFFDVTAPPAQVLATAQAYFQQKKVVCTREQRTVNKVEVTDFRGTSPKGKPFLLSIKPGLEADRTNLRLRWLEGKDSAFELELVQVFMHRVTDSAINSDQAALTKRNQTASTKMDQAASARKAPKPASASWNDRAEDEVLRVSEEK